MKTRGNLVTERAGVNYVRSIVEGAGSFFKEINLQHDVGQDATIVLVVDGHVRPREVALQIKSGISYVASGLCCIPATPAHIYYWAHHDLITLGVVYDPREESAYWMDLQTASRQHRANDAKSGTTFTFPKSAWNCFDAEQYRSILMPTLLGEAPMVSLQTVCNWIADPDLATHDLGVRVLRARHRGEIQAWRSLIDAYRIRSAADLTIETPISIAMLLGHDDIGYYSGQIHAETRHEAVELVLKFGPSEIAKALALLPESDFDRPSLGYSLMPIWGMTHRSPDILRQIAYDPTLGEEVQRRAACLLDWYRNDPDWWRFWRRDGARRRSCTI